MEDEKAFNSAFPAFTAVTIAQAAELRDIENSWAKGAIEELVAQDIISGYPDGTFKPDRQVTRAEFAKILTLALDWEAGRGS